VVGGEDVVVEGRWSGWGVRPWRRVGLMTSVLELLALTGIARARALVLWN